MVQSISPWAAVAVCYKEGGTASTTIVVDQRMGRRNCEFMTNILVVVIVISPPELNPN